MVGYNINSQKFGGETIGGAYQKLEGKTCHEHGFVVSGSWILLGKN